MKGPVVPLLVVAALGLAIDARAEPNVLDDFIRYQVGDFTSAAQAARDSRYGTAIWHIREIWAGRDGGARWLYTESWMKDAKAPYLQRISRITEQADGALLARRYLIPSAGNFVGAYDRPAAFDTLDAAALTPLTGCDATYYRAGRERFEGSTFANHCPNDYKGASYAVSRAVLMPDAMTNWDRGFNAAGDLAWGPAAGGYQFRRVGEVGACDQPVRMLVHGEITDREKFAAYPRALAASKLYEKYGGWYEGITPPLAVFEGNPPKSRGVIIARFPCLEAAKSFWYSKEYQQDILPLRNGAATFEVIVLPTPPLPQYADE
jgi:uncharacterized protein (DUF1330 family)